MCVVMHYVFGYLDNGEPFIFAYKSQNEANVAYNTLKFIGSGVTLRDIAPYSWLDKGREVIYV